MTNNVVEFAKKEITNNWEQMADMKKIMLKLEKSLFSVLQAKSLLSYLLENENLVADNLKIEYSTIVETLQEKIEEKIVAFDKGDFYTNESFLGEMKGILESIVDHALTSFDLVNKANPRNLDLSEIVEAGSELIAICYISGNPELTEELVENPLRVLKGGKYGK